MSHLPHALNYRNYLVSLGITCPELLNNIAQEPYINAIFRAHFKFSNSLNMSEDEEQRIWEQLDCWNKVSPIKGAFIFENVKYRLNTLRLSLINSGGLPSAELFKPELGEGSTTLPLAEGEIFATLVDYLVNEMVSGHE